MCTISELVLVIPNIMIADKIDNIPYMRGVVDSSNKCINISTEE